MRLAQVLTVLLVVPGCGPLLGTKPEAKSYNVRVRVESDPRRPLANAEVKGPTGLLGKTDEQGELLVELRGTEGDRVPLHVACPQGHEEPTDPVVALLRRYDRDDVPELYVPCPPTERRLAVVVRMQNGPNLPVMHRTRQLAKTDLKGVAHLVLQGPPGRDFELTVDTGSRPDLKPSNPGARFSVSSRDDIALFERELTVEQQRVRSRASPSRRPPSRRSSGPVRLQ